MLVLPWIITCLVVICCAWCLIVMSKHLEYAHERIDDVERAMVLGGPEPYAVTDPPADDYQTDELEPVQVETVESPAVDLAGGARKRVKQAREANRERPTPFPRQERQRGAHRKMRP
jgi:hypothetical protein